MTSQGDQKLHTATRMKESRYSASFSSIEFASMSLHYTKSSSAQGFNSPGADIASREITEPNRSQQKSEECSSPQSQTKNGDIQNDE